LLSLQGKIPRCYKTSERHVRHADTPRVVHPGYNSYGHEFFTYLRISAPRNTFEQASQQSIPQNCNVLRVGSRDFEQAMEKASGRDLKVQFDEAAYR